MRLTPETLVELRLLWNLPKTRSSLLPKNKEIPKTPFFTTVKNCGNNGDYEVTNANLYDQDKLGNPN